MFECSSHLSSSPINPSSIRTFSNNESNTDPTFSGISSLSNQLPRKNILYLNSEVFQEEDKKINNKIKNLVLYFLQTGGIVTIHFDNVFSDKILKIFCCDCNCAFENLFSRIFFICEKKRIIQSINFENKIAPTTLSNFANITNALFNTKQDVYLTCKKKSQNDNRFLPHLNEVPVLRFKTKKNLIIYLKDALIKTKLTNHRSPLSCSSIKVNLSDTRGAKELVADTLALISRDQINRFNFLNERNNGPTKLVIEKSDLLLKVFHEFSKTFSKKNIVLNYAGLRFLNRELKKKLESSYKEDPKNFRITNNFITSTPCNFITLMEVALDEMNLKDGDVIRMLETGNNDQTTPMFVAQQIYCILQYSQKKSLSIGIQVIIMGRGGHATTQMFPQFAHIDQNKNFEGTTEAESLSKTLILSLEELNIPYQEVDVFSPNLFDLVQILLKRNSTNTGENIAEAVSVYHASKINPQKIFVCTSTIRQVLTLAQQYSNDAQPLSEKLCEVIYSIPYQRSFSFIEKALTDRQAILDFYANLCEQARRILYAYNLNASFIPFEPNDLKKLKDIYEIYDLLSETNHLKKSKKVPISEILHFFHQRFQIMENAIIWNKDPSLQNIATQNAIKELLSRYRNKTNFEHSLYLFKTLKDKTMSDQDLKIIHAFSELLGKIENTETAYREKMVCFHLIARMRNKLTEIRDRI